MREIKFRVWHEESKMMHGVKGINFVRRGGLVDMSMFGYAPLNRVILMQFTGLRDKNGKEIYEGDIVKATLRFFGIVDQKCRVIFHNGSFGLQYGYSIDYFKPLATWDGIEVIGNIYENPELLRGDGNALYS